MITWKEEEFLNNSVWYHATFPISAKSIVYTGINAKINQDKELDFGYGFYLCPDFNWAKEYIYNQIKTTDKDNVVDANEGYILEFCFAPNEYIKNHKIRWKFFDGLTQNFARFVFRNRMNYKYHIFSHCVHSYDIIGGPMSDGNQLNDFLEYKLRKITKRELFKRLLEPKENWQLLLHSQEICDSIKLNKVYNLKGEEIDVKTI